MIVDPYRWLALARLAWVVFLVYWLVSARKLRKVKQREARRERLFQVAFMAVAYTLVFNDTFGRGWLEEERLLAEEFQDSFREHRRQTGMFLPSLGGQS